MRIEQDAVLQADKSPKEADEACIKFLKLACRLCWKHYYECPECYVLLEQVVPHDCCNSWLENILAIVIGSYHGRKCIKLCRKCMDDDHCDHELIVA